MTALLELDHVTKTYPGYPPVDAIVNASLRIEAGERIAVLGRSGSGKSTLLQIMGTLDRPTSGRVRLDGTELADLHEDQLAAVRAFQIGFVFQQFHLVDHLDAVANVTLGLHYRGMRSRDRNRAATSALERVGLEHRARHRPQELSGGERQRVAIARALVGQPQIILADEPTGNLDSASSAELIMLLAALPAEATTIVVVTHDPTVAAAMDRHISLHDGSFSVEGRPR